MKPMRSCAPTESYPVQFPCLVSLKIDGIRIVKHEGKALTKSLKPVPNKTIARWVEEHLFDGADGEIISGPPNSEKVYTETFSAVMTVGGEPEFAVYLFDLHDQPNLYATERMKLLQHKVARLPDEVRNKVVVVEKMLVYNKETLDSMFADALASGYEGLITQDPAGFYKHGRCTPKSATQMKLKADEESEGEIISLYEALHNINEAFVNDVGESERSTAKDGMIPKGTLGGFVLKDVKTGAVFNCGGGKLTHAERQAVWDTRTSFIGKLVRYKHLNIGVKDAPRHPRWIGWASELNL